MYRLTLMHCLVMLGMQARAVGSDDLANALRTGAVQLQAVATGGHMGECLSLTLINTRPVEQRVVVPAGWRFGSRDGTGQDLLVVEDKVVVLAPNGRSSVSCRAFCCEASKMSPMAEDAYDCGGLADEPLVRVARFIAQSGIGDDAAQQAIWAVSDDLTLSAIDRGEPEATQALREFVSGITGRPVPWYTTAFAAPGDRGRRLGSSS